MDEDSSRIEADKVLEEVYTELRRVAGSYLNRERSDHTLQPTALVHEAYMKLASQAPGQWKDAGHFRALAAQAMRRILIDHARRHAAEKRGGGIRNVTLSSSIFAGGGDEVDLLALEEALSSLDARSPRQARIVELKLFGGLSHPEVAAALELSETTIEDEWRFARAWLGRELDDESESQAERS